MIYLVEQQTIRENHQCQILVVVVVVLLLLLLLFRSRLVLPHSNSLMSIMVFLIRLVDFAVEEAVERETLGVVVGIAHDVVVVAEAVEGEAVDIGAVEEPVEVVGTVVGFG